MQAPGYLSAIRSENSEVVEAYRNSRFLGVGVPHVDPLKEVQAERAKLGDLAASIPLTTVEKATEALNSGDSAQNIVQFEKELSDTEGLRPKPTEPPVE